MDFSYGGGVEFLLIAIILGLIPALIAQSKGRSFFGWWIYGTLIFIVAFVHSLVIRKESKIIEQEMIEDGMRKCPFCAEMVKQEAVKCKHCGSDISNGGINGIPQKTDDEYLAEARRKAGL